MLSFTQYGVQFALPVVNRELHGKEVVPYVSVPTEAVVHAANLESFKAGLQEALWKRPAVNDSERLDDDGQVHDLVCRFPTAKPFPFGDRFPGYSMVVHKSELFDEECPWPDVELTNISVQPENGGTARIRFKMLIRGDDAIDWWPRMMFRAANITLSPPSDKPLPADHPDARGDDPRGDVFAGTDLAADPERRIDATVTAAINLDGHAATVTGEPAMVEAMVDASKRRAAKKSRSKAEAAAVTH